MLFRSVKNNTKYILRDVEVSFHLYDSQDKVIGVFSGKVVGDKKEEGILEGGKLGNFNVETSVPLKNINSYKYFITWKGFQ